MATSHKNITGDQVHEPKHFSGATTADAGKVLTPSASTNGVSELRALTITELSDGASALAAKQPLDATLTALAGLTVAADKLVYATGADAFATTDFSAFARTILDDANGPAVLVTIGGQPLDATLTALAGLTTAADKLVYATASDTFATTDFTAFARTVLDDADARSAMRTLKGPYILAASAVAVTAPADTSENILATISVPAGAMGANGALRIYTLWSYTNTADDKICRVRLGGIGGTAFVEQTATTTLTFGKTVVIQNRNSESSQITYPSVTGAGQGASGVAVTTGTINTANAQDIVLTGQKETAGDTLTLEAYVIELLVP